ncbi:MAG TPA: ABC transporter substrate-binding protein [Pseudorhodoferax sp.]|nr:ABC transporter substrate-binding protein [Pseudorhodoferax sp.]
MKSMRLVFSAASVLALASLVPAHAQGVIKIGEINSYKAQPAFLEPYKKGMELAVEEINKAGGVNGKSFELISRDDNGNPGDTVRLAEELVSREKVDVLSGAFLSNTGLALTDFAKQKKFFYLAGEPLTDKIVWQNGNRYTFRLRPSTYMQVAMLVPEAAKLKKKRWALVYPNYEYGQSSAATFKQLMKAAQPDVEFVAEQATPLGKVDAGSVVQALADSKPDAIFNVLFAADLSKFVREGNTRGLFKGREVVSVLTGEPEYIDPLKDEAPDGWIVTGYPWYSIKTPEHDAWVKAYQAKFKDYPRLGSVVGYSMIHSLAEGIKKAGGTDTDKLITAFKGLELMSPFGKIQYRAQDNQSTMGAYVGRTKNEGGKGTMVNYVYLDGGKFQPSDEEVKKLRPAE